MTGPNNVESRTKLSPAGAISPPLSINVPLDNVNNSSLPASTEVPDPERGEKGKEQENQGAIQRMIAIVERFLAVTWLMVRRPTNATDVGERNDTFDEHTKTTLTEVIDHHVFQGLTPRLPFPNYDCITRLKYRSQLSKKIAFSKSTRSTLRQALQSQSQHCAARRLNPMTALFMIVQNDTMHILNLMDSTLTGIGNSILDDSLIQQNVDHWRKLLNRHDAELRHMEGSLHTFAESLLFIGNAYLTDTVAEQEHNVIETLLAQLDQRIVSLRRRTESSDKSLLTTMSLVESKRGIAEAESVTKLTELAFFFIPLTFSASIFSMQVKELNASVTPISAFVILAVCITLVSYAVRLAVRSTWRVRIWKRMQAAIREDAHLPPNATIPATSFILWVFRSILGYTPIAKLGDLLAVSVLLIQLMDEMDYYVMRFTRFVTRSR